MVVLVSEYTPRMAALVAAALQDRGRPIVVGEMPKAELTVTSLIPLPQERGAVRLQTGRVKRVERMAANQQQRLAAAGGRLLPDYLVALERPKLIAVEEWMRQQESPEPKAGAKPPSDPQLEKAVALLRQAVEKSDKKDDK